VSVKREGRKWKNQTKRTSSIGEAGGKKNTGPGGSREEERVRPLSGGRVKKELGAPLTCEADNRNLKSHPNHRLKNDE